jgi:NADH:ubiquinone oxidoreductase subunit 5 (subunit L)/multisubunit Na+/H+ antiporter MnhA subunit
MIELVDDALTWVFAAPLVASLALFALARAPLLWVRLLVGLAAQGTALGLAVLLGATVLARGGYALFDVDGWVGARIRGVDPTGFVASVLTPSQVPILVAIELAGLLALGLLAHRASPLPSAFSFGGGRAAGADRDSAASSAPSAAVLFAVAMCALVVVAHRTEVMCAAFSLSGVAGFALLVCFHPSRPEVEGAVRAFILHRVGDVLLLVACFVIGASAFPGPGGAFDLELLASTAMNIAPWQRAVAGPFLGFAAREIWIIVAALIALAAATRLVGIPFARDAVGAPAALLGLAHGVCFVGAGLILLLRATPALWLAPEVLALLAIGAAATALVTAVLAVSSRDVARIDVLLLGGFASVAAIAAAAADPATLVLGIVFLILVSVPLCAASGAIIEVTGRVDPHSLGGLERAMPRTHTTRLLAAGALFGPAFTGAAVAAHVTSGALGAPWLDDAAAVLVVIALFMLALAAFRPLHLVFTGQEPKEPLPKRAADPAPRRTIPALITALPLLGLGLAHLPPIFVSWLPNVSTYRSPLMVLLAPERELLLPLHAHVLPSTGSSGTSPLASVLFACGALALGWFTSTLVYRGGVGRLQQALVGGRRARAVVTMIAGVAGGENQVVRGMGEGAIRLSRMIAVNLAPGVLDTLLRRLPSLLAFVVGFVVRLIANGSAQRGIVVAILVLVALLWRGGGAP